MCLCSTLSLVFLQSLDCTRLKDRVITLRQGQVVCAAKDWRFGRKSAGAQCWDWTAVLDVLHKCRLPVCAPLLPVQGTALASGSALQAT